MPPGTAIGLALGNCATWLVGPARRALDAEAARGDASGFRDGTIALLKFAAWALPPGLVVALGAAWALRTLR